MSGINQIYESEPPFLIQYS